MKKNINTTGRWIRGVFAALLLAIAYWKMSWIFLIVGLFVLFEALMSWCVVYHILGINRCKTRNNK